MKKIILTLGLFAIIIHSKAQTFEKLINENKIGTFAFYKTPSSVMTFLFWTKQNKYYISKEVFKQKSKVVETIRLDTFSPISFYLLNEKDIDNSIIRPFTYLKSSSAAKQDTFTLSIAHNSQYEWIISRGQGFKTINLKVFDLWEGSIQNEKNIYFDYNKSQPKAIFFKKMEELLHQLGWTK
jgi:hypothetical protein